MTTTQNPRPYKVGIEHETRSGWFEAGGDITGKSRSYATQESAEQRAAFLALRLVDAGKVEGWRVRVWVGTLCSGETTAVIYPIDGES